MGIVIFGECWQCIRIRLRVKIERQRSVGGIIVVDRVGKVVKPDVTRRQLTFLFPVGLIDDLAREHEARATGHSM